jgi:hypothetical protein
LRRLEEAVRVFAELDFAEVDFECGDGATLAFLLLLEVECEADFFVLASSEGLAASATPHSSAAHKSKVHALRILMPKFIRDNPQNNGPADPGTGLEAQYQFLLGLIALRKCTGQEDGSILS